MREFITLFLFIIVFTVIFSCSLFEDNEVDEYDNVMIFGGDSSLVIDKDVLVLLESESSMRSGGNNSVTRASITDFRHNIRYISQIQPTMVNDHTVQANDIIISGDTAYVAYNTAGAVFDGAIQVLRLQGKKVTLSKEIQFADMDIICLSKHGNELIFGGMANPDVFDGKRSFIGKINLEGPKASEIVESFVYLSSYAATGVTYKNDQYFVSLGAADGGVKILDTNMDPVEDTLETPDIFADDIRDIEAYGSGVIALAGTTDSVATNAKILIIKDNELDQEIVIENFDSPEAKATIEVNDDYAYLGLSAKGFQVYDLEDESLLFTIDNPDIDPLHVTNSISYDDNLIFSANGEYGFRVFDYEPSESSVSVVGFFNYSGLTDETGQNYSANHIAYRGKNLFVASGAGGILVYQLSLK